MSSKTQNTWKLSSNFVMGGIETDKGLQLCGWQAWWNLWTSWSMRKPISKQRSTSVLHSLKAHCSKPSLTNTHIQTHRETQTHTYKPTNTHTTHKHLHTHQLTPLTHTYQAAFLYLIYRYWLVFGFCLLQTVTLQCRLTLN